MKKSIVIKLKDEAMKPKIRNDWGKVKPFTRVESDKTKIIPRKQKYKDDGRGME